MISVAHRRSRRVRAVFVSDIHLGWKHAQPQQFLAFLNNYLPERLYIVGDFIDAWQLKRSWLWSGVYNEIFKRLKAFQEFGTKIYYTPGNHDDFLRKSEFSQLIQGAFGDLQINDEFIHEAADGRQFLVIHGDRFDSVEKRAQWLSHLSTIPYGALLSANWYIHRILRQRDRSPYAFAAEVKGCAKRLVKFISGYERGLLEHARTRRCSGVICGHIHTPTIADRGDMLYCNTGDWVEHCTGLIEDFDGTFRLEYQYGAASDIRHAPAPGLKRLAPESDAEIDLEDLKSLV